MNDAACEVVIAGPSQEWVATFTRQLVDDRLAACGHTINVIRSIYRQEDRVHYETEARVALHTRRSLVFAIVDRSNRDHPLDVPCVIAVPIDGNPADVDWVLRETANGKEAKQYQRTQRLREALIGGVPPSQAALILARRS